MVKKQAQVEVIFVLVIMILLFLTAFTFLSQFTSATPARSALADAKNAIELVCASDGPKSQTVAIFIPQGNSINLNSDGSIELQGTQAASKKLNCPSGIVYTKCVLGPASEGKESIVFEIKKTTDAATKVTTLTLIDSQNSGLVSC